MILTRRCSCLTRNPGSSPLFPSLISPNRGKNWSRYRRQRRVSACACRTPLPSSCFSLRKVEVWLRQRDSHSRSSMLMNGYSPDRATSFLPSLWPKRLETRKRRYLRKALLYLRYSKRGRIIRRRSCTGELWAMLELQMGRDCPLAMMLGLMCTEGPRNSRIILTSEVIKESKYLKLNHKISISLMLWNLNR
jgi:hypothetical protein